jgi:hypothetical protein
VEKKRGIDRTKRRASALYYYTAAAYLWIDEQAAELTV